MRVLNERFADRETDILDGIKVFDERGWVQVLPDPDEPRRAPLRRGRDAEEVSSELRAELRELVEEIMQGERAAARTETASHVS